MAKKVILKDENLIEVMPITRAELVLDSAGNQALHSHEFLATESQPGLTLIHYVEVSSDNIPEPKQEEVNLVQLKSSSEQIYPITTSDAVLYINNEHKVQPLTNIINQVCIDVENSKTILDDKPTEGNTTHSVSSDGIFKELKETVGNIQILLQKV